MGDDNRVNLNPIYFREKKKWFKELLIKFKLIKPNYQELGKIGEIKATTKEDKL